MTQGETKNLGQISAIYIGPTAPENKQLIWYDTQERVHRVYATLSGFWKAINPQVVTNATIETLRNIAQGSGLSIGKFYYLTELGTLAIAVSLTKIWYVDSNGNYIMNDLAAGEYRFMNSKSISIDGSNGVWNNQTNQLEFIFDEYTNGANVDKDKDYIVMRRNNNSVLSWLKLRLKNLISQKDGNSITWDDGLFFDFLSAIDEIDASYISLASEFDVNGISGSFSPSDDLNTFLEKLLYVVLHHTVKEISLNSDFNVNGRSGDVVLTDKLNVVIEKLIYLANSWKNTDNIYLPDDWSETNYSVTGVAAEDSLSTAIGKLAAWFSVHFKDFNAVANNSFRSVDMYYRDYRLITGSTTIYREDEITVNDAIEYKTTENNLILRIKMSSTPIDFTPRDLDNSSPDFTNVGGDNNRSCIILKLHDVRAIRMLLNKFGAGQPFKTDIAFMSELTFNSNLNLSIYDASKRFCAYGYYYAVLIPSVNDSEISHWIKLIPHIDILNTVAFPNHSIYTASMRSFINSYADSFGTYSLSLPKYYNTNDPDTLYNMITGCKILLSYFCVQIPLL